MNKIADVVLSMLELAEAEGRLLRDRTMAVVAGAVQLLIGGLLLTVALLVAAFAAYLWLLPKFGQITALLITAASLALVSLLFFVKANKKAKPNEDVPAIQKAEGDSDE